MAITRLNAFVSKGYNSYIDSLIGVNVHVLFNMFNKKKGPFKMKIMYFDCMGHFQQVIWLSLMCRYVYLFSLYGLKIKDR